MENPFLCKRPGYPPCEWIDTRSRISLVNEFNIDQLNAALVVPGLQKTVKTAVERRLKKILKAEQEVNQ